MIGDGWLPDAWRDRAVTAGAALALLAVGFLLGSFWLEWRHTRLGEAADGDRVRSTPATVAEDWRSRVSVEVLNGLGEPGAARRAAGMLREMGFDVVYFGNADRFDHDSTLVLRRSEDSVAARRLADSLGVARVTARPDPDLYVDGTVILGPGWRDLLEARRAAEGAGLLESVREKLGM